MFEEVISILSICTSMNSWLTPTVLFLLLNLMIGTIAITSGFSSKNNNNNNNNNHNNNHHEFHQQHQQQFQQHQQQQQQQHIQPQISRSNSVLQRLKSINFNNLYTFYTHPPTTHYQSPPPQQPEPEPRPEPEPEPSPESSVEEEEEEGPTMEEIYSRIKQGNKVSQYGRQNSDTKPSGGEIPVKLPQKMKKSASVKSPFNHFHFQPEKNDATTTNYNNDGNVGGKKATVVKNVEEKRERVRVENNASIKEEREEEVVETSVDAKADDFINKFKKQLQLQRNDSILRYKNMISRISAK